MDQTICLDKKSRVILKLASVSINLIWGSVLSQALGFLVSLSLPEAPHHSLSEGPRGRYCRPWRGLTGLAGNRRPRRVEAPARGAGSSVSCGPGGQVEAGSSLVSSPQKLVQVAQPGWKGVTYSFPRPNN